MPYTLTQHTAGTCAQLCNLLECRAGLDTVFSVMLSSAWLTWSTGKVLVLQESQGTCLAGKSATHTGKKKCMPLQGTAVCPLAVEQARSTTVMAGTPQKKYLKDMGKHFPAEASFCSRAFVRCGFPPTVTSVAGLPTALA